MSITSRLETYRSGITAHSTQVADYGTLQNAAFQQHPTSKIVVSQQAGSVVVHIRPLVGADTGPFRFSEMLAYARMLDHTSHAATTYTNVKASEFWRTLYDVTPRAIAYIEAGGPANHVVDSGACTECGLLLPLTHLTVDHQRPQAGGELEAILKVLRAFGLTMEGPKGQKGQRVRDHLLNGAALGPVQTRPNRPAYAGASMDARYTLTETGAVFISVCAAAGLYDELKRRCMNNFLNLAPRCSPCNSSRGNPLRY